MKQVIAIVLGVSLAAEGMSNVDAQQSDASSQVHLSTVGAGNAASKQELDAMVTKPTTPYEILENLKFVLDHQLLLREDFYTDENFNHYFGVVKISKRNETPTKMSGHVADFGALIPNLQAGTPESTISFSFGRYTLADGGMTAYVRVSFRNPQFENLDFDSVTKLFGPGWKYVGEFDKYVSPHRKGPPTIDIKYERGELNFRSDRILTDVAFHSNSKDVK